MSKIITPEEFSAYANYYEEGTESLIQTYIDSAENIVERYLGYSPLMTDYEEYVEGIGSDKLYTTIPHIEEVVYVIDSSTGEFLDNCSCTDSYIYRTDGERAFEYGKKYKVSYSGGWKKTSVPADIKMAVLRIASVELSEANGNIAITSKSELDQSRSFFNYTNYDKFLKPLIGYRSKRIC